MIHVISVSRFAHMPSLTRDKLPESFYSYLPGYISHNYSPREKSRQSEQLDATMSMYLSIISGCLLASFLSVHSCQCVSGSYLNLASGWFLRIRWIIEWLFLILTAFNCFCKLTCHWMLVCLKSINRVKESVLTVSVPRARARLFCCLNLRVCGSLVWEISFPAALWLATPPRTVTFKPCPGLST